MICYVGYDTKRHIKQQHCMHAKNNIFQLHRNYINSIDKEKMYCLYFPHAITETWHHVWFLLILVPPNGNCSKISLFSSKKQAINKRCLQSTDTAKKQKSPFCDSIIITVVYSNFNKHEFLGIEVET